MLDDDYEIKTNYVLSGRRKRLCIQDFVVFQNKKYYFSKLIRHNETRKFAKTKIHSDIYINKFVIASLIGRFLGYTHKNQKPFLSNIRKIFGNFRKKNVRPECTL